MMSYKGTLRIIIKYQFNNRLFSAAAKQVSAIATLKQNETKKNFKTDEDYLHSKSQTVKHLEQLLGISTFAAQDIANTNKGLSFINGRMLSNFYKILKNAGIHDSTIIKYPSLLGTRNLEKNLEICGELADDLNDIAPLLTLPVQQLEAIVQKGDSKNRFLVLSKLLQVNIFVFNICKKHN